MENWKTVEGYENYQVSNLGNIRNVKTGTNKKPSPCTNGYMKIVLYKKNQPKTIYVHRLVATHFIENTYNKDIVNHKNGVKTDNRESNLEWATQSENIIHTFDTGLAPVGGKRSSAKLTNEQASEIRRKYAQGGCSHSSLGKEYGVSHTSIKKILHGITFKER